jgi:dTDP-glucose 4,6-dehydratase
LARSGCKASRQLIRFVADRPGHDRRYAIDSNKIRANLGWTPRYRLEGALEATVDWYLSHMEWIASVRSGEYRKWIDVNYRFRMASNGERSPANPADFNEGGNS